MWVDNAMVFAEGQSISGTSAQNSTNILDENVAKKFFGGSAGRGPKIAIQVTAIGGTSPTLKAQFVGADDNALSVNVIVLAEWESNRVLVAGDLPVVQELVPAGQLDLKRYYGIIWTQGGTAPTATVNAVGVMDNQTNITGIGP